VSVVATDDRSRGTTPRRSHGRSLRVGPLDGSLPRGDEDVTMLWKKTGKTAKGADLTAYIDEASEIEGKFTFGGTVMLNGKFTGEITSNDTLIIGDKGVLNASIRAAIVLVNGEVRGNINGGERIELRGNAKVFGDIEAPVVVVEEGVLFEGHCRMSKDRTQAGPTAVAPVRDLSVVALKG
jgi:cytoskeletal protein CcmA (bactofilin family)